jgi:Uncharacterised conserved protein (DUF2228)
MAKQPDEILRDCFGFDFPEDFFRFQEFVSESKARGLSLEDRPLYVRPANVFKVFGGAEEFECEELETRFYKDPPEFVTLLKGRTDGLHWGYYVDDPRAGSFPVAHYYHNDAFVLNAAANLFEALDEYAQDVQRTSRENLETDPDGEEVYRSDLQKLDAIRGALAPHLRGDHAGRRVTAPTRDQMGIVVRPELYRPVFGRDPFLEHDYVPTRAEVERYRVAALEELRGGRPGAALKLGKDLWAYDEFYGASFAMLGAAYEALDLPLLKRRLELAGEFRDECDSKRGGRG